MGPYIHFSTILPSQKVELQVEEGFQHEQEK
jgi:hypothetical protein